MAAGTKASELRELTDEELVLRLREAKEELFNLRFQMATGQLDNNRRLRTVRNDIARIYTVMRERELGLSVSPDEEEAAAAAEAVGASQSEGAA
ncbi:LSU ribosomal protein L29P [Tamaricihabitans halophyticus]|uniref:Large ribosomal subunit protein uL29 n=1 Tax=Tamaricihabitans halophyticus TaxID=1262583 RepID=A0A4R2QTE6_9PSEU|nr:50S ribosomal protein L29 [Tamaricihabitans halophyticus]TCP53212.1 LSU ribosomal protein L29P [Tamaricihabitans halophyticus]